MNQQPAQPGLFIGMDWADQKHDVLSESVNDCNWLVYLFVYRT